MNILAFQRNETMLDFYYHLPLHVFRYFSFVSACVPFYITLYMIVYFKTDWLLAE